MVLVLTYRTDLAGERPLLDPLTGRRYDLDEAELPEALQDFLRAMTRDTADTPAED